MAKIARVALDGVPYPITQQGNARRPAWRQGG